MDSNLQDALVISIPLGIGLLAVGICMLFSKTNRKELLLVFSLFFLLSTAVLFIPTLHWLGNLHWNWQGKFLTVIVSVLFVVLVPALSAENCGLSFKINKSVWVPFVLLLVLSVGFNIYQSGGLKDGDRTREYLWFQLTLPGLSEEFGFRGIMLTLLNLVFVSRRKILGAAFGWGALIQAIMFGAGHAVYFNDQQHLQFYFEGFTYTFILGIFMTYLREKGESLVPALLFHNLFNAGIPILQLFF